MTDIFASANQVNAEWLTQILRKQDILVQGDAVQIDVVRSYETGPSMISHLAVRYSSDALGEFPEQLFLKSPKPHKVRLGYNEVKFYQKTAGLPHIVPCYDAHYNPKTENSHLLLADMGKTHSSGGVLSEDRATQAIEALAAIHAYWWDHPDLVSEIGASPEQGFYHKYSDRYEGNQRRFRQLIDLHGEAIKPAIQTLYNTVLVKGPDVLLERSDQGNLTLGHHDLHANNILFPDDPKGHIYIIDWQNDWCWWGVKDLAFLLIFSLEPSHCRQVEKQMLMHYCQCLAQAGIQDFSWEKAWLDYRLAAIELLFRPLGNRQAPDVLRNIERSTQAFNDLDCMELF